MTTYTISSALHCCVEGRVTFPEDKTWDDVKDWYVKWDTLWVLFKDSENYVEFELSSLMSDDSTDWKRPTSVTVYGHGADGETNYDDEVAVKGD